MDFRLFRLLGFVLLACSQSTALAVSSSFGSKSAKDDDPQIGFYTQPFQKSYFVGIRANAKGENDCYGVLIAPKYVLTAGCAQVHYRIYPVLTPKSKFKYAVVGSRYNAGARADGSETIQIASYKQFKYYSDSGAVGIYVLSKASKLAPVNLPIAENVNLANGTTLTTIGWQTSGSDQVLSERDVDITASTSCRNRNIWFDNCLCTVAWLAQDACNIENGSPVTTQMDGKDVLLGLRFKKNKDTWEACGISGFPIPFTSMVGVLDWIKDTAKLNAAQKANITRS